MKKLLLILLCVPLLSYAQHSDRVLLIKQMYKETKSYEKKGDCKTINWVSISEDIDNGLKRKVTRCIYPEGYSRITLSYHITNCGGGHWVNAEYYYEDGNLYFAYITHTGRALLLPDNLRLYFTSDGRIEKLLVDYGEGNMEITDKKEIERITKSELEWLEIARTAYRLW